MPKSKNNGNEFASFLAAIQKLQDRREELRQEQADIDAELNEYRRQVENMRHIFDGKPWLSDSKSVKDDRQSKGTSIMEELLKHNNGKMNSSQLAQEARSRGVKYPHSSIQSLKKRKAIRLAGGNVELLI